MRITKADGSLDVRLGVQWGRDVGVSGSARNRMYATFQQEQLAKN
jgi:hypothetical protein